MKWPVWIKTISPLTWALHDRWNVCDVADRLAAACLSSCIPALPQLPSHLAMRKRGRWTALPVRRIKSEESREGKKRGSERQREREREGGRERNSAQNAAAIPVAGLVTNKMTGNWARPETPSSINAPKADADWTLLTGDAIKMDIPPMATPIPLANYHTVVIPPLLEQIIR